MSRETLRSTPAAPTVEPAPEHVSRRVFHFLEPMSDLSIEYQSIESLIPHARNARTHSEEQIAGIAASIHEFGYEDFRFCVENDCYAVDRDGHVYRVCRQQRSKTGRLISHYETARLSGSMDVDGYLVYRMMVNGHKKHVKGHRLVLNAFVGVRPEMCVNHKNGVKSDNRLENLEWVTVAENNSHAIRTGLFDPTAIEHAHHTKVFRTDYVTIYVMHKHFGMRRAELARRNRVCRQTIDNVVSAVHAVLGEPHGSA